MRTLLSLAAGLMLCGAPLVAQRADVSVGPTGDYVIRFTVDGVPQEVHFEAATHVKPMILARVESADGGRWRYSYRLANGADAKQEIHSFTITGVGTAKDVSGPPDWQGDTVEQRGRVYWLRLSREGRRGVPPGQSVDGFTILSTMLPGPANAELRGNTRVPQVAPTMPETALQQLRRLLQRDFVTISTIGPVIAGGANEPELTASVFLARVKNRFEVPLIRSEHPDAQAIVDALANAIAVTEGAGIAGATTTLIDVQALLRRPAASPRTAELNEALLVNLQHAQKIRQ